MLVPSLQPDPFITLLMAQSHPHSHMHFDSRSLSQNFKVTKSRRKSSQHSRHNTGRGVSSAYAQDETTSHNVSSRHMAHRHTLQRLQPGQRQPNQPACAWRQVAASGVCVEHDTQQKPMGTNPTTGCPAKVACVTADPRH